MRRTNNKKSIITALAAVAATLQSGCQSAPHTAYQPYPAAPYNSSAAYNNVQPAAGPVPAGSPPYAAPLAAAYPSAAQQELEAANMALKDRVERVEKAMLRLDRRMQLVERGELNRMGAAPANQQSFAQPAQQFAEAPRPAAPTPSEEQTAMRQLNIGPAQGAQVSFAQVDDSSYQGDFRPVSTDTTIRAPLQAAPPKQLASLADTSPASGAKPQAATDVAVWTIRYDTDKVWPDRNQLPLSRDVVEALRAGANVTLFARGPNPNGAQFRERVKALSRYLAKVTSQDNVPIAALPSPQMDTNTIELLATH